MRHLTLAALALLPCTAALADTSAMRAYLEEGYEIVGMSSNAGGAMANVDDAVLVLTDGTGIVLCSVTFPDYKGGRIGFEVLACDPVEE